MSAQAEPIPEALDASAIRADTLLALLTSRFVDWSHCNGAMRVLGLTTADMSAAKKRLTFERIGVPVPVPVPEPEEPAPFRRPASKPFKAPTVTRPVRIPDGEAPQLRCSQCKEWKPAEAFSPRTDRPGSGTRRSACRDCHRLTGRRRYLNLEALDALGTVGLEFVVEAEDPARLVCAKCKRPIKPGEDASVAGEVGHVECPERGE